jgi:hypothetical protein
MAAGVTNRLWEIEVLLSCRISDTNSLEIGNLSPQRLSSFMYCPSCAAQSIDNAQFCRACGADISFLSKAVTRRVPEKEQQGTERGLRYSFIGAGFLLMAIIMSFVAPAPANWALCFSMLCAAFPLLGSGIATILSVRRYEQSHGLGTGVAHKLTGQSIGQLSPRNTSEIIKPPSVTEGTTKTLRVPSDHES